MARTTGWLRSAAFAFALIAAGLLTVSAARAADQRVTLILNYIPTADHSPYFYAKAQGWYKEAGIDLDIEVGKGSAFAAQTVGAGAAQFGIADLPTMFVARGKGADLVAIMNVYANSPQGFYWLKSSGIKGPQDFPGHTIGNPPGDAARVMWPAFAKDAHIDPDSVHFVNVAPAAKMATLRSRQVDIITDFYNEHDLKVREFGSDLGFLAWRSVGLNLYGNSVITTASILKTQPDLAKKFVQIAQRAFAACVANSAPCLDALFASASGLDRRVQEDQWQRIKELMASPEGATNALGWFDPKRVASDYQVVKANIGFDTPFDPTGAVTNALLDTGIKLKE
jgi:NitT/TauT family transport system substrate-binding protein